MHPHHSHKDYKVQHRRVAHITKGYAAGGAVLPASVSGIVSKESAAKTAHRAAGGAVKHRADRRARGGQVNHKEQKGRDDLDPREGAADDNHRAKGGRAKHKGTTVNIMVAQPHGGLGAAPPPPSPGAAPPMRPPMAAPPVMPPAGMPPPGVPMTRPPMGPPGAPPPGMPLRKSGGRVSGGRTLPVPKGGANVDGPAYQEGKRARPVDHAPGKMDTPDLGRGKVITYKRGGRVDGLDAHPTAKGHGARASGGLEHPRGPHQGGGNEAPHNAKKSGPAEHPLKGGMSPDFKAGAGGALAREKKIKRVAGFVNRVP